jgi:hypothetical protein
MPYIVKQPRKELHPITFMIVFTCCMLGAGWVERAENLEINSIPIWRILMYAALVIGFGFWFAYPRND